MANITLERDAIETRTRLWYFTILNSIKCNQFNYYMMIYIIVEVALHFYVTLYYWRIYTYIYIVYIVLDLFDDSISAIIGIVDQYCSLVCCVIMCVQALMLAAHTTNYDISIEQQYWYLLVKPYRYWI